MVDKTISVAELLALAKDGATIKTKDRPTIIAQFDEMIGKLDQLVKSNEAQAEADLSRSKMQLEVLATLQALIRTNAANNKSLDLSPLKTVLSDLQGQQHVRSDYEFTFERDRYGYYEKILAKAVPPTQH